MTTSTPDYMARLGFDAQELASRRTFFQITDEDLARLVSLRPFAEQHNDSIVDDFYAQLLMIHPESRHFFDDPATRYRAIRAQKLYFLELFSGRCDLEYVENRLRVGATHQRLGVAPKLYLGAYAHYLRLLGSRLQTTLGSAPESFAAYHSLEKLVFFDMSIAIETYIAAGLGAVERHQAALRELSTPVIQVHERILLLPLVGTLDTARALQVMEQVLLRVVETQALVVLMDIAGVPVVDTRVAYHLLQTTEAVRLLGASTILTGISAQVARTLVQLGVDLATMDTRSSLAEGLELALVRTGKTISPRTP
jgi:rsbT co-antagonist protein RsbR